MEELDEALDRAFVRLSHRSSTYLSSAPEGETLEEQAPLVGKSTLMCEVNKKIGLAASFNASVLIEGETGTGKGGGCPLNSPFKFTKKVKVQRHRLSQLILELCLIPFGAVIYLAMKEAAFTGATSNRPGAFELAEGGTLFLDEVSNMTPATSRVTPQCTPRKRIPTRRRDSDTERGCTGHQCYQSKIRGNDGGRGISKGFVLPPL